MSCFYKFSKETTISIPSFEEKDNVTFYKIKVKVKNVEWCVRHRYRDFRDLNDRLVTEQSISRKLLPPKKVIGNKNTAFVQQRQKELEEYLKNLLGIFRVSMPRVFVKFLDFNKYDTIYILQDLAHHLCTNGDSILHSEKEYIFTPLELHSISERMCLPCPPNDEKDQHDFSHVLDFCSQVKLVHISPLKRLGQGETDYNVVDVPIGESNLIPNELTFHLNAFHNLKTLKFYGISPGNLVDALALKKTLTTLSVHNTVVTKTNQIFMCDSVHKQEEADTASKWESLEYLDFSGNLITTIDNSIKLAPKTKVLILNQNRLENICNLHVLSELRELSLAGNLVRDCANWNKEIGNLVSLNLSQNRITQLSGLKKLYSLVHLDISCNLIDDLSEIDHLAGLPLLEDLRLTGNPIASSVDYRPRVLARFKERVPEVYLDNEKASSAELDMALVLAALQCSNIGKQS